ncbi:DUF5681 domain-containing protein [Sphingomonas sp. SAFR-052]|uniref:DUF5681 domain-containing protein n=1 Tax=Sphingomonas sp. SAFR-052 TaxID=3436867 RepID=UPI003F7FDDF2
MTDDVKRTRASQFAPGQSGNAAGVRSRKPKPLLGLADLNRTILKIAASETTLTRGDRSRTVNMLERNAWALASGKGNRLAAKDFLDLVRTAGYYFERRDPDAIRQGQDRSAAL